MADLTNLIRQREDVLSELYYEIQSFKHCDLPYVFGPFSRSVCYSNRRKFFSKGHGLRVFKFHDGIDKYYLVDVRDFTGQNLYDHLVNFRSIFKRLEKEIDKL